MHIKNATYSIIRFVFYFIHKLIEQLQLNTVYPRIVATDFSTHPLNSINGINIKISKTYYALTPAHQTKDIWVMITL